MIAEYVRSEFVESVHRGHAVVVDWKGKVIRAWGDPDRLIFPRSSIKPVQAAAMVGSGLELTQNLLALSASSHSGEAFHLEGVRKILGSAGLEESALQTPADFPLDPQERDTWIAHGRAATAIAMNCSGKHAAMLATCVINGWPTQNYREAAHPLQVVIRSQVEERSGERVEHVGIDGCGAPVLSLSLAGLARTLSRLMRDEESPGGQVTGAMAAFPDYVGGTRRDVTAFMRAVPGLVAKDGAEGVYVAALPDGTAIAVKAEDGSDRARQVALAEILVMLGADPAPLASLREITVLGGGLPVGRISSPLS